MAVFCCRIFLFLLFICNEVSAKCTDYQIEETLKSSKPPWNNYFKISQAVYPSVDMSARLIKIWVNFVNESNPSDVPCEEEGDSTYTWSMSCLYVSGGKISMRSINVFSVGTILPNRRQTRLCIKLPKSCRSYLEKNKKEKMLYFLSTLQDIAIRPETSNPSLNTEECITPGHGKAPAFPDIKQALHGVCWCILISAAVISTVASQLLNVKLGTYATGSDQEKSKAVASVSLLIFLLFWGVVFVVLTSIYDFQSTEFPWYEAYAFRFLLTAFALCLRRLLWCFYRRGGRALNWGLGGWNYEDGTTTNVYSYTIVYPAMFMVFHNLIWMMLGVITEPFWAFPIFVSVVAIAFMFYFLVYQLHHAKVTEDPLAIILTVLSFLAFFMLILVILLVGQSFLGESLVTTIVMNVLVTLVLYWFRLFSKKLGKTNGNPEPEGQNSTDQSQLETGM